MDKRLEKEMRGVYGWKVQDGKAYPPKVEFPDAVKLRIAYFLDYVESGLSFAGALTSILAYNEEDCRKEFELGGVWLPVSDDFRKWQDESFLYRNTREQQVCLAMIYGAGMDGADKLLESYYEESDDEDDVKSEHSGDESL